MRRPKGIALLNHETTSGPEAPDDSRFRSPTGELLSQEILQAHRDGRINDRAAIALLARHTSERYSVEIVPRWTETNAITRIHLSVHSSEDLEAELDVMRQLGLELPWDDWRKCAIEMEVAMWLGALDLADDLRFSAG